MNADKSLVNLRKLLIFIHGVELALMSSPLKNHECLLDKVKFEVLSLKALCSLWLIL